MLQNEYTNLLQNILQIENEKLLKNLGKDAQIHHRHQMDLRLKGQKVHKNRIIKIIILNQKKKKKKKNNKTNEKMLEFLITIIVIIAIILKKKVKKTREYKKRIEEERADKRWDTYTFFEPHKDKQNLEKKTLQRLKPKITLCKILKNISSFIT